MQNKIAVFTALLMLFSVYLYSQDQGKLRVIGVQKVEDINQVALQIASAKSPGIAFTPRQTQLMSQTVQWLRSGNTDYAKRFWESLVRDMALSPGFDPASADSMAMIQWILRQSYLEQMEDLRFHAEKVKYFNEQKEAIRGHLTDMRSKIRGLRPEQTSEVKKLKLMEFKFLRVSTLSSSPRIQLPQRSYSLVLPNQVPPVSVMTSKDIDAYINKWEKELQTVGDDAQLANIDLQNWLQKQQQTIQMLSSVSKVLHDTAMAVIRKIG